MSTVAEIPAQSTVRTKRSAAYAFELWQQWPSPAQWPGVMDLYEAAAYRRVDYKTLWRACQKGRDGCARLSHQRFGTDYRITKDALDNFGLVKQRAAA